MPEDRRSRSRSDRLRSNLPCDGDDARGSYSRGPPVNYFTTANPFAAQGSYRRSSSRQSEAYSPFQRRSSHRSSYGVDVPQVWSSSSLHSSNRPVFSNPITSSRSVYESDRDRPLFRDPFGPSGQSFSGDSLNPSRRSSPRRMDYDDIPVRPPPGRRGGVDFSATAADRYDPFAGELGTDGRSRPSFGDPELPAYRSASAYARGSASRPPAYDYMGSASASSRDLPPPYSSYSGQGGLDSPQFPPTRRPSHYYPDSRRPPDYDLYYRKW